MFRREKIPYIAVSKPAHPLVLKMRARLRKAFFPAIAILVFAATASSGYVLDGSAHDAHVRLEGAVAMLDDARQDASKVNALGTVFLDLGRVRTYLDIETARRALVDDPVIGKIDYGTLEKIHDAFFDGPAREAYINESLERIGVDRTPGIAETLFGSSPWRAGNISRPDILADLVARNLVLGEAVSFCNGKAQMKNCLADEISVRAGRARKEFGK